jgi:hypothetical protein
MPPISLVVTGDPADERHDRQVQAPVRDRDAFRRSSQACVCRSAHRDLSTNECWITPVGGVDELPGAGVGAAAASSLGARRSGTPQDLEVPWAVAATGS